MAAKDMKAAGPAPPAFNAAAKPSSTATAAAGSSGASAATAPAPSPPETLKTIARSGTDTAVIPPLLVANQPQNPLAYTNHVFVAPGTANATPKAEGANYVSVKNAVFVINTHALQKAGTLGINRLQREAVGLQDGDTVDISPYTVPADPTFGLHAMKLEFDSYGTGPQRIIFKEDEVLPGIKETFAGQVFVKGQQFWHKFGQLTLVLSVKNMEAPIKDEKDQKKTGNVTKSVAIGQLIKSTKIKLSVKPDRARVLTLEESDERPPLFGPEWKFQDMGIGGLDAEFSTLFRRAFASRMFPPTVIQQLGIKHVKGMLLYGPPGTGKTLIARQIGKMLKGREPLVVNGPEILNKFVGQSEENIRNLFKAAEAEEKEKKEKSSLHVIIFDEIDAICKQRGTMTGSTGVHDTVVNQLLSKIDGVNSLNNILVIGMTNRKDMIDAALLRPGRLEVHIEIGLPDATGRMQILEIHTKNMREHNRLDSDVQLQKIADVTKNFSGAELEGLVKSASSWALSASMDVVNNGIDVKVDDKDIIVHMSHFERALQDVTPAFGVADDELKTMTRGELFDYSADFKRLWGLGLTWIGQVRNSPQTQLLSVLLEGDVGSGKTALAAKLALDSEFPFTKVISPEMYVGYTESAKCGAIAKIFEDAYKSPLSLIILDNIERLLEYVSIGPRFSNQVLQTLLVLIKRRPPNPERKLLILATTSSMSILRDMEFKQTFNVITHVPSLTQPQHIVSVFQQARVKIEEKEMNAIAQNCVLPIGIKQLLMLVEMAKTAGQSMTATRFLECMRNSGLQAKAAAANAAVDALELDLGDSTNATAAYGSTSATVKA